LFSYCNDDGQLVEPEWYLPILPMILVNGSEGIGTGEFIVNTYAFVIYHVNLPLQLLGWSSYIPNYNPCDIINNLKRLINNEEPIPMHPWYRGFQVT